MYKLVIYFTQVMHGKKSREKKEVSCRFRSPPAAFDPSPSPIARRHLCWQGQHGIYLVPNTHTHIHLLLLLLLDKEFHPVIDPYNYGRHGWHTFLATHILLRGREQGFLWEMQCYIIYFFFFFTIFVQVQWEECCELYRQFPTLWV